MLVKLIGSRGLSPSFRRPGDTETLARLRLTHKVRYGFKPPKTKKGTMSMHDAVSSPLLAARGLGHHTVGGPGETSHRSLIRDTMLSCPRENLWGCDAIMIPK